MQTFYVQKTVGNIKNIGVAYILHDTYIYKWYKYTKTDD